MSREVRRTHSSPVSIQRRLDNRTDDQWESLFEPTGKEKTSKSKGLDLHLDLFNFEEPAAQQSRYVLTSPQSLEACKRFSIKPVELLHKSLEEFVEEFKSLYDTEYSHRAVREVFQEHERQRLRKLKLCREERERIMRERNDGPDMIGEDRKHSTRSLTRSPDRKHVAERDFSSFTRRKHSSFEEEEQSVWRSSPIDALNYERSGSLFGDRGKENLFMMEEKARKPPTGKTQYSHTSTKSRSPISPRGGVVTYGESSDSGEGEGEGRAWSTSSERSQEGHSPRTRKKPTSAVAFRKTAPQRIKRTSSVDSQEFLRSVPSGLDRKALSEKDQRIVDLMMSRHEDEQRARKERLMLELEWDEQRKLEEQLRQARQKQKQSEIWENYKAKDAKQYEVRARRLRNEQRLKKDKVETMLSKDFAWQMEKRKQEQIKENKLLTKKIKDTEKKQKQEENLWQKKREEELHRTMTQLNLLEKHKSAFTKKNILSEQETMKVQSRNRTTRNKQLNTRSELLQHLRQEEESLQHEVAVKHQTALMNYQRQLARKDHQITQSKLKREERIERQQEQLRKLNSDMEEWRKELTVFRKEKDERARDTVTMSVASKQQRVKSKLDAEKDEHRYNIKKVKEAEQERKREIQDVIEVKDERSKMVNTEKEEIRRLNRDAARTSQAVRDLVREQTLRSSFDRMAEAAQRQALVGCGPQTGHKNKSSVKLG